MKKLFLMITLAAGFSIAANAQGGKSPEQRATNMTKALQKNLNLSADQATQVHAIMFEQASRVDSLKANLTGGDKKTNRIARRDIMATAEQKLSAILTADQMKGYENWKAMRKEKEQEKKNTVAPQNAAPSTQG